MNRANINLKNPQLLIMFFIVFALFTTMCVTITGVTQPKTAQVNERINITIDVEVNPAENASYNLIFGFLAPKSWDVSSNAVASYTSTNGSGTMSLASDDSWSNSLKDNLGIGENYGEVKWVAFVSDELITGQNGVDFNGQISLSFNIGIQNIKTQLAYAATAGNYGFGGSEHDSRFPECIEITGGSNNLINLCGSRPYPVTLSPEVFSVEDDIIHITFNALKGDDKLAGSDQVYLCASAMIDGQQVDVCDNSEKMKMRSLGEDIWEISVWPPGLFGLKSGSVMSDITYTFKNEQGDIIIQDPDTYNDFLLTENCN